MEETLRNYLVNLKIQYLVHNHPPIFTVEESKRIIKEYAYLHTKNLFLKDDKGSFYLVCLPAEKRLNIKFLEQHSQVKKLRFGSPAELKSELNLTPGSVSIFGIIHSKATSLILDQDVWDAEKVGFHPNLNTSTLEITHSELEKFYASLACKKEVIKFE